MRDSEKSFHSRIAHVFKITGCRLAEIDRQVLAGAVDAGVGVNVARIWT
jgi:hypothetical protein